MASPLQSLQQVVATVHPLTADEWDAFAALWSAYTAKRKEVLTRPGEVEKYVYFVLEGVQHVFYEDEQDHVATIVFTYPPSFGGVLDSMLLQKPSAYYYETLTPSQFLRASSLELISLMKEHPNVALMIHKGVTGAFSGVMERLVELQSYSAEERFRKMLKRSPHILQLLPHKYLANYIGVDPTNFSKMMNRIRI
jgi:CRP-like cAMP-binding protein